MNPLSFEQIQDSLNNWLGLILSERRTTTATAIILARCTRQQQEWVLEWVRIFRRENLERTYQFTLYAPKALALMDKTAREDWARETLTLYDKSNLSSALLHLQTVVNYAKTYQWKNVSLSLTEIHRILQILVAGLNGRTLQLVSSEITFTDTKTLFLPALINHFTRRDDNFRLYKAMIGHLWAQTWFGTWQQPLLTQITQFNHRDKAIR